MSWNSLKDCKTVQPLLSEYVDATLDADTAWQVKMHLSTCSVCALVASEFAQTASLLGAVPRVEPSAQFDAALARRIADVTMQPRRESPVESMRAWWSARVNPAFRLPMRYGAALTAGAAALIALPLLVLNMPRPQGAAVGAVDVPSVNRPALGVTGVTEGRTLNLDAVSEEHVLTAAAETLDLNEDL